MVMSKLVKKLNIGITTLPTYSKKILRDFSNLIPKLIPLMGMNLMLSKEINKEFLLLLVQTMAVEKAGTLSAPIY